MKMPSLIRRLLPRRGDVLDDGLHPPVNVRIVTCDGQTHAVQTRYARTDPEGVQVFEVVDAPPPPWHAMCCDVLPGMTAIELAEPGGSS